MIARATRVPVQQRVSALMVTERGMRKTAPRHDARGNAKVSTKVSAPVR